MNRAALLLALTAAACAGDPAQTCDADCTGDDTESSAPDCAYQGEFSGAAATTIDYGDDQGCSGSGALDPDRVAMSFGMSDVDYNVQIEIFDGATPGKTAKGLGAAVELVDLSVGYDGWRTPDDGCTIDINEVREDDFSGWVIVGTGSCTKPAVPDTDDVTGEVTVGEFSFSAVAAYPEE